MDNRPNLLAVPFDRERKLNLAARVVTIGAFDGVHSCRQELIRKTVTIARRLGLPVGDFRFGSCKTGNIALLRRNFAAHRLPPVRCSDGVVVSSSRIRNLRRPVFAAAAAALEVWKEEFAVCSADAPGHIAFCGAHP